MLPPPDFESVAAMSSPHSRNHLSMGSTGLDSSCAIVVPRRGFQVTMRKKIARDADLIRSRDCPCRCCSITRVMRGESNPQASGCVPRHHRPHRGIRQCSSFCTYPEGVACGPTKHTRSDVIEICREMRLQELGYLKIQSNFRFGVFRRDGDKPLLSLSNEIAPDLDFSKILVPRLDKPKERDHQAVAIADRVSHFNGSTQNNLTLVHELLAKIDELHACNHRTCRAPPASCRIQASFDTSKPAPVLLRHHGAGGAIQGIHLDGNRMRRVCLGEMISEAPHAYDGDAFGRSNFQCR